MYNVRIPELILKGKAMSGKSGCSQTSCFFEMADFLSAFLEEPSKADFEQTHSISRLFLWVAASLRWCFWLKVGWSWAPLGGETNVAGTMVILHVIEGTW